MEAFPKIKENQFAVIRADVNTGIVLDAAFDISTVEDQKVYSVFDSVGDAIKYIKSIFILRDDTEFVIYDYKNEVVQCISVKNIEEID